MRHLVLLCVLLFAGCESPVEPVFAAGGIFELANAPVGNALSGYIDLNPWGPTFIQARATEAGDVETRGSFTYNNGESLTLTPFDDGPAITCSIEGPHILVCGAEEYHRKYPLL